MRGEWVSRLPYAGDVTDAHGRKATRHGDAVAVLVKAFAPEQSTEGRDGGGRVVTPATLYLWPKTVTDPRDHWIVRGRRYTAEGDEGDWRSPYTGRQAGLVQELRRVTG